MRSGRYNKGSNSIVTPRTIIISFVLLALLLFLYNISLYSEKVCDDIKTKLAQVEKEKLDLNSYIREIQDRLDDGKADIENRVDELKNLKIEVNSKTDLINSLQQSIEIYQKELSNYKKQKNSRDGDEKSNGDDNGEHEQPEKKPKPSNPKPVKSKPIGDLEKIPVIIFAYNRPDYLKRTLNNILQYATEEFPIFVSQDQSDREVTEVIQSFKQVTHLHHVERKPISKIFSQNENEVYYYISQHYEFGLRKIFEEHKFSSVITLEDDIEIAPDFFSYFRNTKKLLETDPTLFCVSAWNDNGREGLVNDNKQLYRTNFFGGLGWMMTRSFWEELSDKWPKAYWDDWLREPDQKKNRDCIRPEVSRTYTFGEKGSSGGQFYSQYLKTIQLNDEDIDWDKIDLSYLEKDNFDAMFQKWVEEAQQNVITNEMELKEYKDSKVTMYYTTEHDFGLKARKFNLMEDWKAQVPRTAYKDVVIFKQQSNTIFLTKE